MRAKEFEKIDTGAFRQVMTPELRTLGKTFTGNGYSIRVVGGAVRDLALKKMPKDVDLATDATPDQMIELFKDNNIRYKPTGLQHGTITAIIDRVPYEITTLRADKETDGRHAKVEYVKDWKADAKRRDLTYNAMSVDFSGKLFDYYGGMDHLQDRVSKFVGDPGERIKEDYLRILRYFRFQSRLEDPNWDNSTLGAIKDNVGGLSKISPERIWSEVKKLLTGRNAEESLKVMGKTGVANSIGLPVANAGQIARLERTKNPIVPLSVLVSNSSLAGSWKMSKSESALLNFLVTNKNKPLDRKSAIDLLHAGNSKQAVVDLSNVQGKFNLADTIRLYDKPEFPVAGKDLIAKGMKPGIEIGKILDKLKLKWKQSGYKLSKDDLLRQIGKRSMQK
jgi:tRNA nucleotidyltransferase (CCA-adding enzyme)|tara:strand:+ start:966 stop:2144 length:1179 start_codon:yes stop_codon:yes gene_type:complete